MEIEADLISFDEASSEADVLVLWQQQYLPCWSEWRHSAKIRRLVLEVRVPEAVHSSLWQTALGSSSSDEATYVASAAAATLLREKLEWDWDGSLRRSDPQLDDLAVISADIPRTLPELQRSGEFNAADLQSVLDAYVASCRSNGSGGTKGGSSGGYTQGMADVGAWLLRNGMKPSEAYGCLHALCRRPLLRSIMGLEQSCWNCLCAVYDSHLRAASPPLQAHLSELGLQPFFFLPEWLVALWARSLRDECARLAWNLLVLDGDRFVLGCALGVTLELGPLLMQCTDLPSARDVLRDGPRGMSLSSFQTAATHLVEPKLLGPLAPWLDMATPVPGMVEL